MRTTVRIPVENPC